LRALCSFLRNVTVITLSTPRSAIAARPSTSSGPLSMSTLLIIPLIFRPSQDLRSGPLLGMSPDDVASFLLCSRPPNDNSGTLRRTAMSSRIGTGSGSPSSKARLRSTTPWAIAYPETCSQARNPSSTVVSVMPLLSSSAVMKSVLAAMPRPCQLVHWNATVLSPCHRRCVARASRNALPLA
jgi:hypothetical protein